MRRSVTTRSFKLPAELEQKMIQKLVADGYGLRGKSRWIADAIKNFLAQPEEFCIECVDYAEELGKLDKSVSFRPTQEVDDLLDEWIIRVRKVIPEMDGVKSKIIRASIIQGLLHKAV